jgi:hypothetical protein
MTGIVSLPSGTSVTGCGLTPSGFTVEGDALKA